MKTIKRIAQAAIVLALFVLAGAQALAQERDWKESQAETYQFTCLEAERSRCRLLVAAHGVNFPDFPDRAFALKVGETIVFDLVANEKRRCWNGICGVASRYEWPDAADTRLDGDDDQVIHTVFTCQELVGAPERRREHPGYSGWHAPLRVVVPHAPAKRDRFTCVDAGRRGSTCSVEYYTEGTTWHGLPVQVGQSVVHDHLAQTLQVCSGDACTPLAAYCDSRWGGARRLCFARRPFACDRTHHRSR